MSSDERKKGESSAQIPSKKGVKPSKEVLKRFFADGCTTQEVQIVHQWFATAQGQKYVSKNLDEDFKLLSDGSNLENSPDSEVDSEKIFNGILKMISQKSSKD